MSTKLILSTGNIVSGGPSIIRKPGAYRSNLELTNSLRSAFLAAKQDCEPPSPTLAVTGAGAALSGWTSRVGSTLYVPRLDPSTPIDPSVALQEPTEQYDVTAKLFFLPHAPSADRAAHAREALALVRYQLGVAAVDLLIASFPDVAGPEGDYAHEADRRNAASGRLDDEAEAWHGLEELHYRGEVRQLGVAEFSGPRLHTFLGRVRVRPAVDQVNLHDCCKAPAELTDLARREGIVLLVHRDCTDVLPSGTLRELLGSGMGGAGLLVGEGAPSQYGRYGDEDEGSENADNDAVRSGQKLRGDITPLWVIKYTALVKDRGVIENKGYFAAAELVEA